MDRAAGACAHAKGSTEGLPAAHGALRVAEDWGSVLALLGPGAIRQLQADLLEQVKRKHGDDDGTATLSVRFAKNIVVGSFHSMILQAVEDGEIEYDPFPRLKWPRAARPEPDPFGPKDVPRIIRWFARARFGFHPGRGPATSDRRRPHLPYFAYVHALFWTGLRPSEASGLEWRDVDLEKATANVRRSYHLGATGAPKTDSAHRTIELFPLTVEILRAIQPLRVTPTTPVFTTTTGTRIEPKTFSRHWYDCLRTLGLRMRASTARRIPSSPWRSESALRLPGSRAGPV